MKLTTQIGLRPTPEQATAFQDVMRQFNAAANYAAKEGMAAGVFSQATIHRRCYKEIRKQFGLSAQMAVRAIGKAVEVFQRDKTKLPLFRSDGAITYDERCITFKGDDIVSILTQEGRILVPMVYGEYQKEQMGLVQGQADLICRDGQFYLHATIEQPIEAFHPAEDFIGVDLGVVNLAVTSDKTIFSGEQVEKVRQKRTERRRRLQKAASKKKKQGKRPRSIRRALKRLGNKEARFRKHNNHCISKTIVQSAQDTKRGIAVEDLKYIRSRIRFAKALRARMGGWAFAQLQQFLCYKAERSGVWFMIVEAAYTSQQCSQCGHCDKANRPDQASFVCTACGYTAPADYNAARNIAARAACNAAKGVVATKRKRKVVAGTKPSALADGTLQPTG